MAERSRLARVLGVEEDERFTRIGYDTAYRVHSGRIEYNFGGVWCPCSQITEFLTEIINDPSLIVREPRPRFSDEEMTVLRWLYKHGQLKRFCKTLDGRIGATVDGIYGLAGNIVDYLLKPGEKVNLDDLFKVDEDGRA